MSEIKKLTEKINQFNAERDWDQFHAPKDLALSLVLEAAEVLEHFQWKTNEEFAVYLKTHKEDIADELGDVMNYLLQLADAMDIDIMDASRKKMEKNAKKYPVEKAKGSAKKYTELK